MGPEDLLKAGSADARMLEFLKACVQAKISILISGGTGSGKTTLLNVLSSFIPAEERILTIEDAAELLLQQPHVVRLESRPPNIEGRNQIAIRQLVVNALRMRPSRIVVGECRAGEALDMLQAMNTGHAGSMTTLHANSPRDALNRLETLVLMAGEELPAKAIREQIASAIRIVVHLERFLDGSRKVVSIADLRGMKEGDFDLQEIFVYDRSRTDSREVIGRYQATGLVPSFLLDIERESIFLDRSLFGQEPVLVGTVSEGGLP
jgi:pilus assembly protein CpaF